MPKPLKTGGKTCHDPHVRLGRIEPARIVIVCKRLRVDAGQNAHHVQRVTDAPGVVETIPSVEIALDAAEESDTMLREMPQGVHLAAFVHNVVKLRWAACVVQVVWLFDPETPCVPMPNAPEYAEIAAVVGSAKAVTRSDAEEIGAVGLATAANSAASVGLAKVATIHE